MSIFGQSEKIKLTLAYGIEREWGSLIPFPQKRDVSAWVGNPSPQGHAGHGVDLPPAVAAAFAAPSGATPV